MKTYQLMHFDRHIDLEEQGGVYFGDPCYVVPDGHTKGDQPEDLWNDLCNLMYPDGEQDFDDRDNIRVVEDDSGIKWYTWSTAYGDGCYRLNCNYNTMARLGVDAGMLSVIPLKLIKKWGTLAEAKHGGFVYTGPGTYGEMRVDNGDFEWNNFDIATSRETVGVSHWDDEDEEDSEY